MLGVSRTTYYKHKNGKVNRPRKKKSSDIKDLVCKIYFDNRRAYGAARIRAVLVKQGRIHAKKTIRNIMKENDLVSTYNKKKYKAYSTTCNESQIANKLNREFYPSEPRKFIVTDLTYVQVGDKWNFICFLIDLFNREIVGHACGKRKTAELVKRAFLKVQFPLKDICLLHSDRGREFMNQILDELFEIFDIERSLSAKGCPYDNAVAEATYKSLKTEFVSQFKFKDLEHLERELFYYVHWWNNVRLHSTLNYQTPKEVRENFFKQMNSANLLSCSDNESIIDNQ